MSTFSQLSLLAQYDDVCRLMNKMVKDHQEESDEYRAFAEESQRRFKLRLAEIKELKCHREQVLAENEELRIKMAELLKENKKDKRLLQETRSSLARKDEDIKIHVRQKKALANQIKQIRQLVLNTENLDIDEANRKRFIQCLDTDRLSPIQSDESEDDCVSGLDYDRTEDEVIDEPGNRRTSTRRSNVLDALEDLPNNEQPTLPCRYYFDNGSQNVNDNNNEQQKLRRSSRKSTGGNQTNTANHQHHHQQQQQRPRDKYPSIPTLDSDSNCMESDTGSEIENVRQLLNKYEEEKKQKLNAGLSTPNVKYGAKSATLGAQRSTADLMKTASTISTPVPNTQKSHQFSNKKSFKPETCGPCGVKIPFYGTVCKCEHCGIVCHPNCKDQCPLPCVKITAPVTRSRTKKILISDYVSSSFPKVPAIIVHCCNEIERDDNIVTENLYRSVASTQEIEELQQKILKSKSGMPNLSNYNVHLLTGVVKRFLQGLDESLVTTTLWSQFAEASQAESMAQAKSIMSVYITSDLPVPNRDTLAFIMQHLHAISKCADKNLMPKENLVKTLAPTIVGNSCINPPHERIKQENKIQNKIMETLFELEEEFWEQFVPKAPKAQRPLGSRLLAITPSSATTNGPKTRSSLRHGTLPTPKMKSLFS